jgi:hypothetical protein
VACALGVLGSVQAGSLPHVVAIEPSSPRALVTASVFPFTWPPEITQVFRTKNEAIEEWVGMGYSVRGTVGRSGAMGGGIALAPLVFLLIKMTLLRFFNFELN